MKNLRDFICDEVFPYMASLEKEDLLATDIPEQTQNCNPA